ncbi:hypothetical protein AAFF_G00434630 [Aldrovandia affinis]|uniref:Zona pellucida sperm-binding protein 4 n=1 Tax=Aldrovandia affinis TaxID=143900 RepID=A0AAD7S8B8_9TELE|nr:hypothetical protein AAFF_G00434630 [Aldrovandia affinis]
MWVLFVLLGIASAQMHQDKYFKGQTGDAPFHRCQVSDFERVQCGDTGIDDVGCEAINCCFDRAQCFYAKEVTVQCLRDGQFVVVVASETTVPRLSLDSVSLLEGGNVASCGPVSTTPAFVIFQFPEEGGYVVYENELSSSYEVASGPLGSITRDSVHELSFQCRYFGSELVSLVAEVNTVPPPLPVAAPGPLRVELRLANGQCDAKGCSDANVYSSYYSGADYPVTKVLRDPVYVEVRILERTDPNIVLTLEHCWPRPPSALSACPSGACWLMGRHATKGVQLSGETAVVSSEVILVTSRPAALDRRVSDSDHEVLDKENSIGGEEAAFPGGMSPELFPSPSGTVAAGPGEGAMSPSMERAALPTTLDLDTPPGEWGDSEWEEAKPTRKRALSGGQEHPRGNKSAPAVPLTNRFEALAGTGGDEENGEGGMGMNLDFMACSPEIWPPFDHELMETDLRTPNPPGEDLGEEGPSRGDVRLCQVSDFERVPCGDTGIDGADCEAINCCFDRAQCFYAKEVTVQCLRDGQFVVVVASETTVPRLSLDSVSLLEGGDVAPCRPVGTTPAFVIFQFPVSACGTTMREEGGYVVYENELSSSYEVASGPLGSITRDSVHELSFQCRYFGSEVVSLVAELPSTWSPLPHLSGAPQPHAAGRMRRNGSSPPPTTPPLRCIRAAMPGQYYNTFESCYKGAGPSNGVFKRQKPGPHFGLSVGRRPVACRGPRPRGEKNTLHATLPPTHEDVIQAASGPPGITPRDASIGRVRHPIGVNQGEVPHYLRERSGRVVYATFARPIPPI